MKPLGTRAQRTLASSASLRGVGYITGKNVHLTFRPAPVNTGIVFVRTDLGRSASIPALVTEVIGTNRRTSLGCNLIQVTLVEHVMAALTGLHVDNCYVELDAPEPPGLDGSAHDFVDVLLHAGFVAQRERRPIWGVDEPILLRGDNATLGIYPLPTPELKISYHLDYGAFSPIVPQISTVVVQPESFVKELACCRTFLLEEEARQLKKQGYGARTELRDLLVFGPHGPIDNELRFGNEPARHKILDIVGDLGLFGADIRGHIVGYRSGHPLNVELARTLYEQTTATCGRPLRAAA